MGSRGGAYICLHLPPFAYICMYCIQYIHYITYIILHTFHYINYMHYMHYIAYITYMTDITYIMLHTEERRRKLQRKATAVVAANSSLAFRSKDQSFQT